MADRHPDQNTQFVACAAANFALIKLSTNLTAYLAGTVSEPRETRRQTVDRLLGQIVEDAPLDQNWTDLEPGQYDADAAHRIALEMLGDAIADIRRHAL